MFDPKNSPRLPGVRIDLTEATKTAVQKEMGIEPGTYRLVPDPGDPHNEILERIPFLRELPTIQIG